MKIYTKTGDKGETGLVGGTRVSKADLRLETYGDVDELNSQIGLLFSLLKGVAAFQNDLEVLEKIQNALFSLGSNLACERDARVKFNLPVISEIEVSLLERKMDEYEEELSPLKNFILPNGSPLAAQAHVARSVCRRVERKLVAFTLSRPEEAPENAGIFLNRLSDFLFVFARHINHHEGKKETIWKV